MCKLVPIIINTVLEHFYVNDIFIILNTSYVGLIGKFIVKPQQVTL